MFTRCPECQSLFRLTPEQLRIARGKVRCGKCSNVFDALDELVEQSDGEHTDAAEPEPQVPTDEDPATGSTAPDEEQAPEPEGFSDTRLLDEELLEASGILEAPEFADEAGGDEDPEHSETDPHNPDQRGFTAAATDEDETSDAEEAATGNHESAAGRASSATESGQDPWQGLYFDDEHGIPDGGTEPAPATNVAGLEPSRDDHTATHWNMEPLSDEHESDDGGDSEHSFETAAEDDEAARNTPRHSDPGAVALQSEPTPHQVESEHNEIGAESAIAAQRSDAVDATADTGSSEENSSSRTFLQRLWGSRKHKGSASATPPISAACESSAAAREPGIVEAEDVWGAGASNEEAPVDEEMAGVFDSEDDPEVAPHPGTADHTESSRAEEPGQQHAASAEGAGAFDDRDAANDAGADTGEEEQRLRDDGQVAAPPGAGGDLDAAAAAAIDLDEEINAALDALDDEQYERVAPRGLTEADIGATDEAATGPAAEAEEVEPEALAAAGHDDEDETAGAADLAALFSEAASDDLDDSEQRWQQDECYAAATAGVADDRSGSAAVEIDLDEELDAAVDALSDEHNDEDELRGEDQAEFASLDPNDDEDEDDFAGVFEGLDALDWDDDGPADEPAAAAPKTPPDSAANESQPVEQSLLADILRENQQKSVPVEVYAETSGVHLQLPDESDLNDVDEEAWENLSAQLGLGPASETAANPPGTADAATEAKTRYGDDAETATSGASAAQNDDPTELLYETFVASTVPPADPQLESAVADAIERDIPGQPETRHSPATATSEALFPGSPPPRGKRLMFAFATAALALLLVAQLIHARRDELLADSPFAPTLRSIYETFGYPLPENWDLSAYDLRQMSAIINPDSPNVIRIKVSLRNRAARAQPYPVIRLILIDIWGEPIGQRDLLPAQYLGSEPPPQMAAGENVIGEIAVVEPQDQKAENFEIDACLTLVTGELECANPR